MPRFPLGRKPAPPQPGAPVRRHLPPPSQLRRDRRALLLVRDRCAELVALEDRIAEIDALLSTALSLRHRPAARCECGAPILWGSKFCTSCGRAVVAGVQPPSPQEA